MCQEGIEGLQRDLTTVMDLNEETKEERCTHEHNQQALQSCIADYQRHLEQQQELKLRIMDLFAQAIFCSSQ